MRGICSLALAVALSPLVARAQEAPLKLEPLAEAPPAALADAVKGELESSGVRVLDARGKAFADVWLRKSIPASGKPAGPKGAIQFPVLAEGQLLGAIRYAAEGGDYRDQPIVPGAYTLRYGLQPVNGDHLGVSPHRDYALLVPAKLDTDVAPLSRNTLEDRSAEAAGSSHPAVLVLLAAPDASSEPKLLEDEEQATWGVALPLKLAVEGEGTPATLGVQLIVVGRSEG